MTDLRALLPRGTEFAFTILDDTDDSTVENAKPFYDLLHELGLRTTKTVWPVDCPEGSRNFFAGRTLADEAYRAWVATLPAAGFELTWHGATMESSPRERTERGLARYRELFGRYPRIHVNHALNRENLYWGPDRYSTPLLRLAWRVRATPERRSEGHRPGSPWFWGDLAREHMHFTRAFAFAAIDTLRVDADLVYRLERTPWVRCWFSSSDAPDARAFKRLVTKRAVDRLRAGRGICILSTHVGKGFVRDGRVDPEIEATLRHLAALPGWFVPVGELLDRVLELHGGTAPLRPLWRQSLHECRHVVDRLLSP